MSDTALLNIDQLHLRFGQTLQIHQVAGSTNTFYDCRFVGGIPCQTLIITVPESGEFPVLHEGENVAIRVKTSSGVAVFPTLVLIVSESPIYMVYLDYPKAISFKQVRRADRVNVALPVLASNVVRREIRSVVGQISDISTSGAHLQFEKAIGLPGEELKLKGKFSVADIRRTLSLSVLIRSKAQNAAAFEYGVEFIEPDEEQMLVLFGFVYSAMTQGEPNIVE